MIDDSAVGYDIPLGKAELRGKIIEIVEDSGKFAEGARRLHAVPRRPSTGMSRRGRSQMKGRRRGREWKAAAEPSAPVAGPAPALREE